VDRPPGRYCDDLRFDLFISWGVRDAAGSSVQHHMRTDPVRSLSKSVENLAPWRVAKAKALLLELMSEQSTIQKVAKECAVSRSHFSRAFRNTTGFPPHVWLRREKISKAESLLKQRNISISEVAYVCGFSDQSYFTRVFRASHGVTPKQWQMRYCDS
jgi:AraC family transcriptional regulator